MRKRALVNLWICFAKAKENREIHNAFLTEKQRIIVAFGDRKYFSEF
jgi:hypothetical protein